MYELLGSKERQAIIQQTFHLLETNGVSIKLEAARTIFAEHGCTVNGENVKIPSSLVKECLSSAPSCIDIYDRTGKLAMKLGGRNIYYGPGPTCPNFFDIYTGERRPSRKEDASNVAKLVDALDNMDFAMSLVMISDHTKELADIHEIDAMIRNTSKPIVGWAFTAQNLQIILDMGAAVAGGMKQLQEKPFLIMYCEPTTPFIHSPAALKKLILLAKNRIPCVYTPGMIMGATAPVTIAGALSVGLTDCLTGLVLSQLINKGTPFIAGAPGGPMDMKTMQHSYGAPEWILTQGASSELVRDLGLPSFSAAGCSDSKVLDGQSAAESMLQIFIAGATGGNLIHDVGFMDLGITGSALHMVICDELIGATKRFLHGIDVDQEHLAEDVIVDVGPGGNYLAEEHTFEFFRDEIWSPKLFNRENYAGWQKNGSKTLEERARDYMLHLLGTHTPEPLSDEAAAKLDAILKNTEEHFETQLN